MCIPVTMLLMLLLIVMAQNANSLTFTFPSFERHTPAIAFQGHASASNGTIHLTKLVRNSVGRVYYSEPVRIWDKSSNKLADFESNFSIVVNGNPHSRGDGLAFFMIPYYADHRIPKNSSGGFLGLFNPKTAFDKRKNHIVALEFDSFHNEWDPEVEKGAGAPHLGIDINSLRSVEAGEWFINSKPKGSVGEVQVNYLSELKEIGFFVSYGDGGSGVYINDVDLRSLLPEWVRIGFSASTGDAVETHQLLSWSFSSNI